MYGRFPQHRVQGLNVITIWNPLYGAEGVRELSLSVGR